MPSSGSNTSEEDDGEETKVPSGGVEKRPETSAAPHSTVLPSNKLAGNKRWY